MGQLIDADWGDAEILVVDLPPGTGDVQLTMIAAPQAGRRGDRLDPAGPRADGRDTCDPAVRAAATCRSSAWSRTWPAIACPHCGEVSDPFGQGGAEAAAKAMGHAFLGRVPLDIAIRQDSDAGRPPAACDGPQGEAFAAIARRVGGLARQSEMTWQNAQIVRVRRAGPPDRGVGGRRAGWSPTACAPRALSAAARAGAGRDRLRRLDQARRATACVTVAVPQLEMGQGITTLLPQIVAVELGADWRQVAVEPAPRSARPMPTRCSPRAGPSCGCRCSRALAERPTPARARGLPSGRR